MEGENHSYKHDAMQFGENATQHSMGIDGGIMQNYRRMTDQKLEDMLEGDYWQAKKDISRQASKYFNTVTSDETDMMNNTKNFTMRHRLNRELDFTDDFRKKYLTKEYGNYDKYTKNSVTNVFDDGSTETD